MNRKLWLFLFVLLPAATGCQEMIYPNRVEVPFSAMPAVLRGDDVVLDGNVIGVVGDIVRYPDHIGVVTHVTTGALPQRAVFLVSRNKTGRTCLDVYRVPENPHAARGPYWGATTSLELATYLGRERGDAIWSAAQNWLLNLLRGDPEPIKK